MMYVEPVAMSLQEFPASALEPEGMVTLPAEFDESLGQIDLNVQYAEKDGYKLHLQILRPVISDASARFPLIGFVQGSGWGKQGLGVNLPGLLEFAKRGFVVAIIEYRPSDIAPFPAQVKDAITAIRFLIAHAAAYNIGPTQIVMWGDSSGGHTISMINMTMDNPEFTDEPDAAPINIRAFVDYFGPTDISRMNEQPSTMDHLGADSPEGRLIGGVRVDENPELVRPTIPMTYINGKQRPQLIIHGDKDRLVPFQQSVLLYEALRAAGSDVEFYKLAGADHGGSPFWTKPVLDIIENFVRNRLR